MPAKSGLLNLHIHDSNRELYTATEVLVTLMDGFGRQLHRKHHMANVLEFNIELADNLRDLYTVNVSAHGRPDMGFTPVPVKAEDPQEVHVMLTRKDPQFHFLPTLLELRDARRNVHDLLVNSGLTEGQYQALQTAEHSAELGTLLNTLTALDDMPVRPGDSVLSLFYKEVLLDCLRKDRFFCEVDSRLEPFLAEHPEQYSTAGAGLHDAKACETRVTSIKPTGSLKQTLFMESNVQFTFYGSKTAGRIVVENDIDYFADTAAHTLIEVFPNSLSKLLGRPVLTDPRRAYVLRWIQSKNLRCWKPNQTPVGEFAPPFSLV